jgi:hypothetical protein
MKLEKFTTVSGHLVYINPDYVIMVRQTIPELDHGSAKAVIVLEGAHEVAVGDTVGEVLSKLNVVLGT